MLSSFFFDSIVKEEVREDEEERPAPPDPEPAEVPPAKKARVEKPKNDQVSKFANVHIAAVKAAEDVRKRKGRNATRGADDSEGGRLEEIVEGNKIRIEKLGIGKMPKELNSGGGIVAGASSAHPPTPPASVAPWSMREQYRIASQLKKLEEEQGFLRGGAAVGPTARRDEAGAMLMNRVTYHEREQRARITAAGSAIADVIQVPPPQLFIDTVDPYYNAFFRDALNRGPRETASPHLNPNELQKCQESLIVSPRRHEEEMLRTPEPHEPACAAGAKCHGAGLPCNTHKKPLMAYYPESDWNAFQKELRERGKDGRNAPRLPNRFRHCLVCLRKEASDWVIRIRLLGENGFRTDQTTILLANIRNIIESPGEYCIESCNGPTNEGGFNGLVAPIVHLNKLAFRMEYDVERQIYKLIQLLPFPRITAGDPVMYPAGREHLTSGF